MRKIVCLVIIIVLGILTELSTLSIKTTSYAQGVECSMVKKEFVSLDVMPTSIINTWSKGIQNRNGYTQYSVLCEDMKVDFKKELKKSNRTLWVTGYSSPWVSSYNIINIEKIGSTKYKFTVNFDWETSIGHMDSTKAIVTTVKVENKWCISNIEWDEKMKKRIF